MARTTIDFNMFISIKTLLKCGSSRKEVADHLKVGIATVDRVKSAETWEEYRNITCLRNAEALKRNKEKAMKKANEPAVKPAPEPVAEPPKQVVEHRQSITLQATHFMEQSQRKGNETLELISRKLTAIMEQQEKTNDLLGKLLECWKNN